MECIECNWNRVSTWDMFMSRLMPFCGLILPQASCDLFFIDLKRGARVLFVPHLKSVKSEMAVRPICFSLISLMCGARALFLLGFYTYKIILLYHNRAMVKFLPLLLTRSFWFFVCAKFHTSCQSVRRFGLLIKYRHSFATVIPLNHFVHHEIRGANRPLSHGGHFESQENKKLCFCTSSLALDERLDVQNLLFQHCAIKVYCYSFGCSLTPIFLLMDHFSLPIFYV